MATGTIDRREVLGLAGAALALCGCPVSAAAIGGLIDVHHHIRPPGTPEGLAKLLANWSPESAIADMDRCGVAAGIAYPGPIRSGEMAARATIARGWNEFGARLMHDHPSRFGLFASLPFPFVEATLAEIDYAYDHLGADGFGLATSYGEAWLGDAALWPIYEKLNARAAVVFVHPHDAVCCAPEKMSYNQPIMDGSWIEWPINTARTIMSLMVSGTLRRYPRIRWIFAHGGGVMPLLIERIKGLRAWPAVGDRGLESLFPNGVGAEFRSLYFECAQAYAHPNIDAIRTLVPDDHLLFGSDYPIFPLDHASGDFAALDLKPLARQTIGRTTAGKLLPRWA